MALLQSAAYDPTTAVAKATDTLLAMTALDTTNLRLTFTAPANGSVLVRLRGPIAGATTFPRVLFGVLESTTVVGRAQGYGTFVSNVATYPLGLESTFLVTGLTPGSSHTYDAAYGVEIVVASTNIVYGGPDDNAGADAYGAFLFEIWETPALLAGKLYDPGTAVTNKATSALLAMTAFDTTNLRLTFTAPASGKVFWRMRCVNHGSTAFPMVLFGVMNGAAVASRSAVVIDKTGTSLNTTAFVYDASGVVAGLTSGNSYSYDAAYAVQVQTAATNFKYGGPDDTTTNNAWGGFVFEIWNPTYSPSGADMYAVGSIPI